MMKKMEEKVDRMYYLSNKVYKLTLTNVNYLMWDK